MWINVNDRLPSDHGRFLVATGSGTVLFLEWNNLPHIRKWGKCGTDMDYWTSVVTHWQPVPVPPAAEQGESAPTDVEQLKYEIAALRSEIMTKIDKCENVSLHYLMDKLRQLSAV